MNKEAMYKLGYGLYVLTAKTADGAKDNGCIINTVIQVTTTPNRISICVNKANYTHDIIQETGEFNISIISEKAEFGLFKHFGFQTGREVNKFADYPDAVRSNNGLYVITRGINAFISGKVVQTVDLGTHTMFIADVTDGGVLNQDPSATYSYYQSNIKPKPQETAVKGWRCKICGYIYEGEELPEDFICPVCKHGAIDFEKIQ